jgi:predicted GTPase
MTDVVVIGSPSDIARLVMIEKPVARARYEFAEAGASKLARRLDAFFKRIQSHSGPGGHQIT